MPHNTLPPRKQLVITLTLAPSSLSADDYQHCQETLPLFVTDELAGLPVDELYPATAVHLDICPFCLLEYEELVRLATTAFYGDEAAP